jgi:hypothetical protein
VKRVVAALAIFGAGVASAQVIDGDTYGAHQYGNWAGVYVAKNTDMRFRAYTASNDGWGMTVDVIPGSANCRVLVSLVFTSSDKAMSADRPGADYYGAMRVDQQEVFSMRYFSQSAMGDKSLIFSSYAIDGLERLIDEMSNGQSMRAKVSIDGQDYYPTFALNGFGNAFQTEYGACKQAVASYNKGKQARPKSSGTPSGAQAL